MIGRMWLGQDMVELKDSGTGRTLLIAIPGSGLLEKVELEELILDEIEKFRVYCAKPLSKVAKVLTKSDEHALGKVCLEILSSKRNRRLTGHGKYW